MPGDLTVEQLAHETGMSVRNIRNHQSRGLLPPPEVRARIGYYGPEHVERLRLIQEMQAEGFNLEAIKRLLGDDGAAAARLLGVKRVISMPEGGESPEILTTAEVEERFGPIDPKVMSRARKLELLIPLGEGRYEVPSPTILRAAEEVLSRGVPLGSALDVMERVRRHSDAVARAFVRLFLEELWKPFEQSGQPDERWPEVTEAIESLRPLASQAVLAAFQLSLAKEMEDAFGKTLERQAKKAG
jgi:DNA-binding transcriptional MerR regulator